MRSTLALLFALATSVAFGFFGCSAMLEFKDYDNPNCGNGKPDPGEECDDGAANSDVEPDACRSDCRAARCGDGVKDTVELCDSGAANGEEGRCNTDCSGYVSSGECGDGKLDAGEACDGADLGGESCQSLGWTEGGLGCTDQCALDTSGCFDPPICQPVSDISCGSPINGTTVPGQGSWDGLVGYCGNLGEGYTGREIVYKFKSPQQERVAVSLQSDLVDLDLFVLDGPDTSCGDNHCYAASVNAVASDGEHATFLALPDIEYYIVVDGFHDAEGDFDLSVSCLAAEDCINGLDDNGDGLVDCADPDCLGESDCSQIPEANCGDGLDNNGDGQIDCADQSCLGMPECVCPVYQDVSCGDTFYSDNYSSGSSNLINYGYCGTGTASYPGPERVFHFVSTGSYDNVIFKISELTADLDLFAVMGHATGCEVGSCQDQASGAKPIGANPGLGDEDVLVKSYVPSTAYYFIVEGWAWAKGEFHVEVVCSNN